MTLKKDLSYQIRRWQDFISCFNQNDAMEFLYWHSETVISSDRIAWTRNNRCYFITLQKHIILAVIGMYQLFPHLKDAVDADRQMDQLDDALEIHKKNITSLNQFTGKSGLENWFSGAKRQLLDRFWKQGVQDKEYDEAAKRFFDNEDKKIQLDIPPGDLDSGEVLFSAKQVFALLLDIIDFGEVLFEQEE